MFQFNTSVNKLSSVLWRSSEDMSLLDARPVPQQAGAPPSAAPPANGDDASDDSSASWCEPTAGCTCLSPFLMSRTGARLSDDGIALGL